MRIALATCRDLPDWEVDDRPLEDAFRDACVELDKPAWDDRTVDWSGFDACLIRTTWDYSQRREAFVAWADHVATRTRLFNPADIVRWNTDKRYLHTLKLRGVPTIPTIWLERGTRASVESLVQSPEWDRGFLKPVIGASSSDTLRFRCDRDGIRQAQQQIDRLLPAKDMMLQPYYPSVEVEGEYSVIFVDGQATHAVRKVPVPGDYRVQDDYGAHDEPATLDAADLETATNAMRAVRTPLLYGRADFLRAPDGSLRMNELELVEPSLFFRHGPDAAKLLAQATVDRVTRSP